MNALLSVLAGVVMVGWAPDDTDNVVDLTKMDRTILKEPDYVAPPQYALFVLDTKAKVRVWAVLDKSRSDLDYYDVLYFDKDADGDLTDEGERFTGAYNSKGEAAGLAVPIRVGDFAVPGTDLVHTDLLFSTVPKKGRRGVWFKMKWNGKDEVSGGYSRIGIQTTVYGESPHNAPILWPTIEGPLSFGIYTWGPDEQTLKIGTSPKVYFTVGNPGSGTDTLCAVDEEFLNLETDRIVVSLIAQDADGQEVVTRNEIKGHC